MKAEKHQRTCVGRDIEGARAGRGVQEIESVQPDEQQHQKASGARAEEPVVQADSTDERQCEITAAA